MLCRGRTADRLVRNHSWARPRPPPPMWLERTPEHLSHAVGECDGGRPHAAVDPVLRKYEPTYKGGIATVGAHTGWAAADEMNQGLRACRRQSDPPHG